MTDARFPERAPAGHKARDGAPRREQAITLLVSLGLHVAAVAAVLLFLRAGAPKDDEPDKPIQVELVMEEHKGDAQPEAAPAPPPQAEPAPRVPPVTRATPKPVQAPVKPDPDEPRTPEAEPVQEARTEPQPAAPEPRAARESVPAPAAPPAITINLRGTDSPSNARARGDRIIPAAPDAIFHNRPPEYPQDAAMRGERGTVVVLIHVSPAGQTDGVDVISSSGYVMLDRSVREAVLRWRFLPAVKDGQPVASDMKMGFVFENE